MYMGLERSGEYGPQQAETEKLTAHIEYTYMNMFGANRHSGTVQGLELPATPEGTTDCELIVHTSYGEYLLTGRIKDVDSLLSKIKQYCELQNEFTRAKEDLNEAEYKLHIIIKKWQREGDNTGGTEARELVDTLRDKLRRLERQLQIAQNAIQAYKA